MATIHGANEPYPLSHTLHSSVWHPIRKGPFNSNSSTYSCAKKTFPKQVTPNLCFCAGESKRPDEVKILHRSKLAHILSEGRKFCPLLGIREVPWYSRIKTLVPRSPNSSIYMIRLSHWGQEKQNAHFIFHCILVFPVSYDGG